MYYTQFFFYFFASSLSLFAKNGNIKGYVFEPSGAALPYANVLLLQKSDSVMLKGAVTDEQGMYHFDKVSPGEYIISVRMVGYQTQNLNIIFTGEDLELEAITVTEGDIKLGEVVVTAARPMIEVKNNAVVLNVSSSPILNSGTAFEAVQRAPGVSTDQDGRISLRGRANVSVMIDGKMTYLSTEEVIRLLQNTPANQIESIEVMQNPPAKYDASGNAGIINIKFKRPEDKGIVGVASLNAGYGKYYKVGGGLNLNYRSPKTDILFSYSGNQSENYQALEIERNIPAAGGLTNFHQNSYSKRFRFGHSLKLGADYNFSKKTSVGAVVNLYLSTWDENTDNETRLSGTNLNPFDRLFSFNYGKEPSNNISGNVHFKHVFDNKGTFTFDADYSKWYGKGTQDIANRFYKGNETGEVADPLLLRMDNTRNINISAFKADYSQPLSEKSKIEAGLKSSFVRTNNELYAETPRDGVWQKDELRSNDFVYAENIHAGYFTYSTSVKKFNFSGGLRGEYTYFDGYSPTMNQRNEREYMSLFPSLSVAYAKSEKHQFEINYGRRIDRPNYRDLNPFVFMLDKYTYNRGNPFLNPQFTNTFGAGYTFMGGLNVNLSYSNTNSAITQVLEQDNAAQATYQTTVNLNRMENYSLSVAAPLPLRKWWFLYANLNTFYNKVSSPFSEGVINAGQLSAIANLSNTFTLPHDFKLEATAYYQTPLRYGVFELKSQYQFDLGLSKKVGKWNLRASLSDVFNTRDTRVKIRQGSIDVFLTNKWETRVVRLNATYQFGNNKIKMSRGRRTAADDIEQRAK
jgi:hypothetical protein